MPRDLSPTDVPRLRPIQIARLADGGIALRGRKGLSLLRGVAPADLERVLDTIDGERTVTEICSALATEYETAAVRRLLQQLLGNVLRITDPRDSEASLDEPGAASSMPTTQRLLILGDGDGARRLQELLGGDRLATLPESLGGLAARWPDFELVICFLEDAAYAHVLGVQEACLRDAIASLFVIVDPDGVRIGPTAVPGAGPCFACAQAAILRVLRLEGSALLAAVADFRTGRADPNTLKLVLREVAREARAVLAPEPRSALSTSVALISDDGGRTTYSVAPAGDCPLCGAYRNTAPLPLAVSSRRELLTTYRQSPRRASSGPDGLCRSIGIIGGGTAGYLSAMALRRRFPRLPVTLIESSALPVIGVGEATTPLMPQFLHVDLRLDIHQLFREVQPTLKLGIRFEWGRPAGAFNYPFGPIHVLEPIAFDGDLAQGSPQSMLMNASALPLHHSAGGWRSDLGVDTAYHLDNGPFVRYLSRQAESFGVTKVDARIAEVQVADDGESVTGLVADDGRRFAFDLYIDCSGFRSLLLEQTLGSAFQPYQDSLFTDRALVASVPHGGLVEPYTLAQTWNAGWCWSTPQRSADHRGYVFSSAFANPEEAEGEMRRRLPGLGETRLIKFRTGRHEHFWCGNVVAMGNAYGFVEPLESTALHMLIRQIGLLLGALPVRPEERGVPALLNRKVGALWDYLAWFLALHYRFNQRVDSPFWQHCRRHVDISRHHELVTAFTERGPLSYQGAALAGFPYPDPLWGAEGVDVLLLGQGVPTRLPQPLTTPAEWHRRIDLYRATADSSLPQACALEILDDEPALLAEWVAAFQRVGPAFG